MAEHETNKTPSNREKHENANARRKRDVGGEKGDKKRSPNRRRPKNWKGPWPPAAIPFMLPRWMYPNNYTCPPGQVFNGTQCVNPREPQSC